MVPQIQTESMDRKKDKKREKREKMEKKSNEKIRMVAEGKERKKNGNMVK